MTVWEQVKTILRSRKFWALVTALTTIASAFASGQITPWEAVQAAVASLGAYSIGTALEGKVADPPK